VIGGFFILPRIGAAWFGNEDLGWWAWWLTLGPMFDTPRAVVSVALQGTRRMLPLAQLETTQELGRVFLVTTGAVITGSPQGAILGDLTSRVLAMFVSLEIYREARADGGTFLPALRSVLRFMPEIPLRQGLVIAIRLGIVKNLSSIFLRVLPKLLIGAAAGLSWVAYFQIAQRIMDIPMMFLHGVSRTMLPALAEKHGLKDLAGFRRLFLRTTWLAGGLIALAILAMLPLIPFVLRSFYPDDYARPVFLCASILAVGYVPMAFAVGLESFYLATNQLRANVVMALAGCAVTIPAYIWLVRTLPETGAIWGQSFYMSWVFVHFAYVAWWFRRAARTGQLD
jgi:O-antigen/teichoic acid export membrane protein